MIDPATLIAWLRANISEAEKNGKPVVLSVPVAKMLLELVPGEGEDEGQLPPAPRTA